jgi:hypothetical protein
MSRFGRVLSFCIPVMAVCGFASGILTLLMVEELNKLLPADRQFDAIGWNPRTCVEFLPRISLGIRERSALEPEKTVDGGGFRRCSIARRSADDPVLRR